AGHDRAAAARGFLVAGVWHRLRRADAGARRGLAGGRAASLALASAFFLRFHLRAPMPSLRKARSSTSRPTISERRRAGARYVRWPMGGTRRPASGPLGTRAGSLSRA